MTGERKSHAEEVSTVLVGGRDLPPRDVPRFVLEIFEGPEKGQSVTVDESQPARTLLGKGPLSALKLTDPKVSRRHLSLSVHETDLRIQDLGSTNGSFVNGVRLVDGFVKPGDIIILGDTRIRVATGAPASVKVSQARSFGRVMGSSAEMRRIYPLCERLAASDVPVVVEGETGTGKELLAESLHEEGPRAKGPFVVFDCTAVPPNLVESALFGHERGAFTGAVASTKGVFEQADGGTLLIDEVGDLDLALQPKLLRAIERSEVRRVGGDKWVTVNVRVVSATRRDLDREIQAGRFRDDLFYRLAVARIELPPLRERHGDIPMLAEYFWKKLGGGTTPFPYELLLRFEDYGWPGNIRELHNAVARRIALGDLAPIQAHRTPTAAPSSPATTPGGAPRAAEDIIDRVLALDLPLSPSRDQVVDEFERRYVQRVLSRHQGDVAKAAAASGIARRYFQLLRARQAKGPGGV